MHRALMSNTELKVALSSPHLSARGRGCLETPDLCGEEGRRRVHRGPDEKYFVCFVMLLKQGPPHRARGRCHLNEVI